MIQSTTNPRTGSQGSIGVSSEARGSRSPRSLALQSWWTPLEQLSQIVLSRPIMRRLFRDYLPEEHPLDYLEDSGAVSLAI